MLLFWSWYFLSAFSHKISSNISRSWKYKQSHIFTSPCRNGPFQLQSCRTKRFFTVFGTLSVTWRQYREIVSPAHPKTDFFVSFLQVRKFHSVWYVRHCTASMVVPKYGPPPGSAFSDQHKDNSIGLAVIFSTHFQINWETGDAFLKNFTGLNHFPKSKSAPGTIVTI